MTPRRSARLANKAQLSIQEPIQEPGQEPIQEQRMSSECHDALMGSIFMLFIVLVVAFIEVHQQLVKNAH